MVGVVEGGHTEKRIKLRDIFKETSSLTKLGLAGLVLGVGLEIGAINHRNEINEPNYSIEYNRVGQISRELSTSVTYNDLSKETASYIEQIKSEKDSLASLDILQEDHLNKIKFQEEFITANDYVMIFFGGTLFTLFTTFLGFDIARYRLNRKQYDSKEKRA